MKSRIVSEYHKTITEEEKDYRSKFIYLIYCICAECVEHVKNVLRHYPKPEGVKTTKKIQYSLHENNPVSQTNILARFFNSK